MIISKHYRILVLLTSCPSIGPNKTLKNICQRHSVNIAVSPTEAVVTLPINMNTLAIHLGGAPLAALVLPPVDPLCAGDVGGPREGEGENTG